MHPKVKIFRSSLICIIVICVSSFPLGIFGNSTVYCILYVAGSCKLNIKFKGQKGVHKGREHVRRVAWREETRGGNIENICRKEGRLDGTESWENVIGFIEPVQINKTTF